MTDSKIRNQFQAFINCPSLWLDSSAPFALFTLPSLQSISVDKEITLPENVVFGRKMESFFSHAISNSDRYDLLAENLQVISDKVTLGELDFLLRDKQNGQLIHVELACKFYLFDPKRKLENEFSHWVGPNQNDFLDRKIEKLKSKQLPLLHHPECKKLLEPIVEESEFSNIIQQVHLPANLYLPFGKTDIPNNINPKSVKGFWLKPENLGTELFKNSQFYLPPKYDWLLSPSNQINWIEHSKAIKEISQMHLRKKSPLVWMKTQEGSFMQLFVVWW